MISIAIVSHGFPEGGIARVTLDLVRYCRRAAPDIHIVILSDRPVGQRELPDDLAGLTVIPASRPVKEAIRLGADILVQCSRVEKDLKEAREKGIRIIYAEHGEPFHERYAIIDRRMGGRRRSPLKRLLWHLFLKKRYADGSRALAMARERSRAAFDSADAFVVLCKTYRRVYENEGYDPSRLHVIPNSEPPVTDPCLQKEASVLWCGRLTDYDKKPARMLRIWAEAEPRLPGYRLDIVGDGPERPRMEALAGELGLQRCHFHGWHKDVGPWYRKADILCLTSQTEAWPLCLTEAQANGVIPIAFDCSGGVAEILAPDGENGFLVTAGDEQAFAQTLVRVAELDDAGKQAIRQSLLRKAASYDPAVSGEKWVRLFRSLMGESAAQASAEGVSTR